MTSNGKDMAEVSIIFREKNYGTNILRRSDGNLPDNCLQICGTSDYEATPGALLVAQRSGTVSI